MPAPGLNLGLALEVLLYFRVGGRAVVDGQSPSSTAVSGMRGTKKKKKIRGENSTMICLLVFSRLGLNCPKLKSCKSMGCCVGDFQSHALSGQRWSAFLSSSRTYVGCPPLKATIWTEILSGNRPMGWGGGEEEEEEAVGQFRSGGAHFFPVSPAAAMQDHTTTQSESIPRFRYLLQSSKSCYLSPSSPELLMTVV